MGLPQVAFLFIGQTPRPDTMEEMKRYLTGFQIREYGALDDVSDEMIAQEYAPMSDEDLLISKLRDGRSVQISEAMLGKRLQIKLNDAVSDGAQMCVLMCTGSFSGLQCKVPLLTMDEAFHQKLEIPLGVKGIGVIVPLEQQKAAFAAQYMRFRKTVLTAAASPYGATETIIEAAIRLKEKGADCICLDCMGYTDTQAEEVAAITALPVYTPRCETANQIIRIFSKQ